MAMQLNRLNKQTNKKPVLAAAILAAIAMSYTSGASATAVEYNGALFDVFVTGGSGATWKFRYTADFTSNKWDTTGRANDAYIAAVGFKVSDAKSPTSITLDGTDAPGTWLTSYFNLNNDGCLGPGSKDNACTYAQGSNTGGGGKDAPTSGTYYWDFTITFEQAVPPSAFGNAANPIRAWFVGPNGADCVGPSSQSSLTSQKKKQSSPTAVASCGKVIGTGLMSLSNSFTVCSDGSCDRKQVPEPGSLALLALGIIGLAETRRRVFRVAAPQPHGVKR